MTETTQNTLGDHDPDDAPNLNPPLQQIGMVETIQEHDPLQDMLSTRNVRAQIINYFTAKGVPTDLKEVDAVRGLLKDLDAAALGKMRVQVDSKQADISEQNRLTVLAALGHLAEIKAAGQPLVSEPQGPRETPVLPDDVVTRDFVPGEATQGTVHATFDQFQQRHGEVSLANTDKDD